jgi:spermidine/putrescine transport system substrate-binding protein
VRRVAWFVLLLALLPVACSQPRGASTASASPPLVIYSWSDDVPQSVLDAFTAETNIAIKYVTYKDPEEAVANLRAGEAYDVVLLTNRFITPLIKEQLLAPIEQHRLANFKNVSPNFRDLSFDPGNRYTIPFSWGTAGLVARSDLVQTSLDKWADLWDASLCGRIVAWRGQDRYYIGAALKTLGYSANTEVPAELQAARERLLALRPCIKIVANTNAVQYMPAIVSGKLIIGIGNPHEAHFLRTMRLSFAYYLPEDGALLWNDSYVIPASSTQPEVALQFLDFLLRPEISATVANTNFYQVANDAAHAYIDPSLLADPMLYPSTDKLRNAEILLPLSAKGERQYAEIWEEFLGAE